MTAQLHNAKHRLADSTFPTSMFSARRQILTRAQTRRTYFPFTDVPAKHGVK